MDLSLHVTAAIDDSWPVLPSEGASGGADPTADLQPEKRLMFAVLAEAIRTLRQREIAGRYRRQRLILEARAWLVADDREWPFSFVSICDALGLDASQLRRRLAPPRSVAHLQRRDGTCERRRA